MGHLKLQRLEPKFGMQEALIIPYYITYSMCSLTLILKCQLIKTNHSHIPCFGLMFLIKFRIFDPTRDRLNVTFESQNFGCVHKKYASTALLKN